MRDDERKREIGIVPEPTESSREAIAAALERTPGGAPDTGRRSAWWVEGVRESVAPPPPTRRSA